MMSQQLLDNRMRAEIIKAVYNKQVVENLNKNSNSVFQPLI